VDHAGDVALEVFVGEVGCGVHPVPE
jgi:hypothetical protein